MIVTSISIPGADAVSAFDERNPANRSLRDLDKQISDLEQSQGIAYKKSNLDFLKQSRQVQAFETSKLAAIKPISDAARGYLNDIDTGTLSDDTLSAMDEVFRIGRDYGFSDTSVYNETIGLYAARDVAKRFLEPVSPGAFSPMGFDEIENAKRQLRIINRDFGVLSDNYGDVLFERTRKYRDELQAISKKEEKIFELNKLIALAYGKTDEELRAMKLPSEKWLQGSRDDELKEYEAMKNKWQSGEKERQEFLDNFDKLLKSEAGEGAQEKQGPKSLDLAKTKKEQQEVLSGIRQTIKNETPEIRGKIAEMSFEDPTWPKGDVEDWKKLGKIDFKESAKELFSGENIPFIGAFIEMSNSAELLDAINALQDQEYLGWDNSSGKEIKEETPDPAWYDVFGKKKKSYLENRYIVEKWMRQAEYLQARGGRTIGGLGITVAGKSLPFMIELLASAGIGKILQKGAVVGTQQAAKQGFRQAFKQGLKSFVNETVAPTVRTLAVVGAPRSLTSANQRLLDKGGVYTEEDYDNALAKGSLDTLIEYASEASGASIEHLGKSLFKKAGSQAAKIPTQAAVKVETEIAEQATKGLFTRGKDWLVNASDNLRASKSTLLRGTGNLMAAAGGIIKPKELTSTVLKMSQYNGLVGEWGEEVFGNTLRVLFGVNDFSLAKDNKKPDAMTLRRVTLLGDTWSETVGTLLGMAAPGTLGASAGVAYDLTRGARLGKIGSSRRNFEKIFNFTSARMKENPVRLFSKESERQIILGELEGVSNDLFDIFGEPEFSENGVSASVQSQVAELLSSETGGTLFGRTMAPQALSEAGSVEVDSKSSVENAVNSVPVIQKLQALYDQLTAKEEAMRNDPRLKEFFDRNQDNGEQIHPLAAQRTMIEQILIQAKAMAKARIEARINEAVVAETNQRIKDQKQGMAQESSAPVATETPVDQNVPLGEQIEEGEEEVTELPPEDVPEDFSELEVKEEEGVDVAEGEEPVVEEEKAQKPGGEKVRIGGIVLRRDEADDYSDLDNFLNQKSAFGRARDVRVPGFKRAYLRVGRKVFDGTPHEKVIQIANIEAEKPGSGAFNRLIEKIKKDHPDYTISVNEVVNESFADKLEGMGFREVNHDTAHGLPTYVLDAGSPVLKNIKKQAFPGSVKSPGKAFNIAADIKKKTLVKNRPGQEGFEQLVFHSRSEIEENPELLYDVKKQTMNTKKYLKYLQDYISWFLKDTQSVKFESWKEAERREAEKTLQELNAKHKEILKDLRSLEELEREIEQENEGQRAYLNPEIREALKNGPDEKNMPSDSAIDPLTGLVNRRYGMKLIENHTKDPNKIVLIIDIDYFKAVNDIFGHATGDSVLKNVARVILENFSELNSPHTPIRYGGEEFVVVIDTSDPGYMDRVKNTLNQMHKIQVQNDETGEVDSITVSGGMKRGGRDNGGNYAFSADKMLYGAKQSGRNRIVLDLGNGEQTITGNTVEDQKYVKRFHVGQTIELLEKRLRDKELSSAERDAIEGALYFYRKRQSDFQRKGDNSEVNREPLQETRTENEGREASRRDLGSKSETQKSDSRREEDGNVTGKWSPFSFSDEMVKYVEETNPIDKTDESEGVSKREDVNAKKKGTKYAPRAGRSDQLAPFEPHNDPLGLSDTYHKTQNSFLKSKVNSIAKLLNKILGATRFFQKTVNEKIPVSIQEIRSLISLVFPDIKIIPWKRPGDDPTMGFYVSKTTETGFDKWVSPGGDAIHISDAQQNDYTLVSHELTHALDFKYNILTQFEADCKSGKTINGYTLSKKDYDMLAKYSYTVRPNPVEGLAEYVAHYLEGESETIGGANIKDVEGFTSWFKDFLSKNPKLQSGFSALYQAAKEHNELSPREFAEVLTTGQAEALFLPRHLAAEHRVQYAISRIKDFVLDSWMKLKNQALYLDLYQQAAIDNWIQGRKRSLMKQSAVENRGWTDRDLKVIIASELSIYLRERTMPADLLRAYMSMPQQFVEEAFSGTGIRNLGENGFMQHTDPDMPLSIKSILDKHEITEEDYRQFNAYWLIKHLEYDYGSKDADKAELKLKLKGLGIPQKEYQDLLDLYASEQFSDDKQKSERIKRFEAARKDMIAFNKTLIAFAVNANILTKEEGKKIQESHPNYCPMLVADPSGLEKHAPGGVSSIVQITDSPVKRRSSRQVDATRVSGVEATMIYTQRLINLAAKKQVEQGVISAGFALSGSTEEGNVMEGLSGWIVPLSKEYDSVSQSIEDIIGNILRMEENDRNAFMNVIRESSAYTEAYQKNLKEILDSLRDKKRKKALKKQRTISTEDLLTPNEIKKAHERAKRKTETINSVTQILGLDPEAYHSMFKVATNRLSGEDVVRHITPEGKIVYVRVHPGLVDALKVMDPIDVYSKGFFYRAMDLLFSLPAAGVRLGATGINLLFSLTNPVRDVGTFAFQTATPESDGKRSIDSLHKQLRLKTANKFVEREKARIEKRLKEIENDDSLKDKEKLAEVSKLQHELAKVLKIDLEPELTPAGNTRTTIDPLKIAGAGLSAFSKSGVKAFKDLKGFVGELWNFISGADAEVQTDSNEILKSDIYALWRLAGGELGTGYSDSSNLKRYELLRDKLLRSKTLTPAQRVGVTILDAIRHPIDTVDKIRSVVGFTEAGPRLQEFETILKKEFDVELLKKGVMPSRKAVISAIIASHDVTTDFRRMGEVGRHINRWVPFFNASFESLAKMARTIRDHPIESAVRISYGVMANMAIWFAVKDEDWYKTAPAWLKYGYWHFPTTGDYPAMRIPKPYNWFTIFMSTIEEAANVANGQGNIKEFLGFASDSLLPSFLPTAVQIPIELMANETFFGNRPIVAKSVEGQIPTAQFNYSTSNIAIWLGEKTGLSPMQLDYVMDQVTGGSFSRYVKPLSGEGFGWERLVPFSLHSEYSIDVQYFYDFADEYDKKYQSRNYQPLTDREKFLYQRYAIMKDVLKDIRDTVPIEEKRDRTINREKALKWIIGLCRQANDVEPLKLYPSPTSIPFKSLPKNIKDVYANTVRRLALYGETEDRAKILKSLNITGGKIDEAVEYYLQNPQIANEPGDKKPHKVPFMRSTVFKKLREVKQAIEKVSVPTK